MFAQVVAFPGTCDVGSLLLMPLFMRSNVAVILRTSAVVRPPPLIQACRPTGPCNSGGKKKNIPRASACLHCHESSLCIFGATKSPLLCSMGGQSLYIWPLLGILIRDRKVFTSMQKMAHFYCATLKTLIVVALVHSAASMPRAQQMAHRQGTVRSSSTD